MDVRIKNCNFVHDDEDIRRQFANEMSDWCYGSNEGEKREFQDLKKVLDALGDKLTSGQQPEYQTRGWEQARAAFEDIVRFGTLLVENHGVPLSEIQQTFFTFMLRLLDNSMSILHLKIAYFCLDEREFDFKGYTQTLDKAKLDTLFNTVCCQSKIDKKTTETDYNYAHQRLLKQLPEILSEAQIKSEIKILLDLVVFLYLDCWDCHPNNYRILTETGKFIMDTLDEPFDYVEDFPLLKSYIKRCCELISSSSFNPHKDVVNKMDDFIGKFMEKLGARGLVEEFYNEAFDLAIAATKCSYKGDKDYAVVFFNEATRLFRNTPKKEYSKNASTFQSITQRYAKMLDVIDMKFVQQWCTYSIVDDALKNLYASNKSLTRAWVELLVPLFKRPCESTMRATYTIASESKAINWKEHAEIADQVFELIEKFEVPVGIDKLDKKEKEKIESCFDYMKRTICYIIEGMKKAKMLKAYSKRMMNLCLKFMATKQKILIELSEDIAEKTELNIKEDKNTMIEAMRKFHEILKDEDNPWMTSWPIQRAANDFIHTATEPIKDGKILTDEDIQLFVSICLTCLKYDCINPDTGQFPSIHYSIFLSIINPLNRWLQALNKMNLAADLVPKIIELLDVDDSNSVSISASHLNYFGMVPSGHKAVAPYLDKLIEAYLEKENTQLLQAVNEIYPTNPKALRNYFPQIMEHYEESGDPTVQMYIPMLLQKVSKKQAELFTDHHIEVLIEKAQENINSQVQILMIIQELCKRRPESLLKQIDVFMDKTLWNSMVNYFITDILTTLAFFNKDVASKVLDDLFLTLKGTTEKTVQLTTTNAIRMIGFKYPDLLKPKRSVLEAISFVDPDVLNLKKLVLDMIDGKTSDEIVKQMKKQEEELNNLIGRVDDTEESLAEVKGEVEKQGAQINNVQNEVKEQGQRLDKVETTVEETVAKVEEIDQKTLSHAPYWSRDISKLLNPTSEHDWCLLSKRLQYSNDDIRGWAQQADPCMAMLNEWYATHKTSEATLSILTQLQEMDRMDAAIIVENAMKNAEAVVEDEAFEYASPPPIFISYQWGHQNEVKLLKQHLEMAGYECWLDVGQMGGGDKLFEKIDTGIRAAKVVISCVTTKYAKSPNCNREVNLSVSLNKPIIPLLLEQCPWPPPGSMGPIFSEYLFIRFFQRKGEELEDQRFWPKDKFQELLMQFNVLGLPPDEEKVQPVYRNWWMPVVEEIKIDKSKTQNGGQASETIQTELDKKASDSPDVFISYQWGKQKNIIKLYERLTSLGFSCWLDIKQMGGGDSLFDKIDRGIRGCKVVLSCVTQKYALSANCRREVSLTDALKKPLVPLLMEQMTWPPAGPMSMVMTQLLYINFAKDESVQMTWDGPKFDELLSKIHEHVPVKYINQSSDATNQHSTLEPSKQTTSTRPLSKEKTSPTVNPSKPQSLDTATNKPLTKPSSLSPIKPSSKPVQPVGNNTSTQKISLSKTPPLTSPPQTTQTQPSVKPPPQTSPVKKLPLTKVPPVRKISPATTKPPAPADSSLPTPSSKPLLKPISSEPLKTSPASQNKNSTTKPEPPKQTGNKPTVKPAPNSQTRRPSKLPPLEQSSEATPAPSQNATQKSSVSKPPPSQYKKLSK
ncbi:uncharacterized protein LOC131934876 [Physella acuta]|uniref:uncharacterized protein LOC131934876 n=1 Tax=Physella acuta TaxID=109671 RepID=UPI0027DAD81A|nr:uncharacterized protein LOC131934876 [Physella acuta]